MNEINGFKLIFSFPYFVFNPGINTKKYPIPNETNAPMYPNLNILTRKKSAIILNTASSIKFKDNLFFLNSP